MASSTLIIFLILSLLSLISIIKTQSSPPTAATIKDNCDNLLKSADQCVARAMLIGNPNITVFQNLDDINREYCSTAKADMKCASSYRTCLKSFPRTFYHVILTNLVRVTKDTCKNDAAKQEFIDQFKCFNLESVKVFNKISNKLSIALDYVAKRVPINNLIPSLCCGYFEVLRQAKSDVQDLCPSNPLTGEYTVNMLRKGLSEAVDLTCGPYSTIEICEMKVPKIMKRISKLTSKATEVNKLSNLSPIIPLLEVIKKLDSSSSSS